MIILIISNNVCIMAQARDRSGEVPFVCDILRRLLCLGTCETVITDSVEVEAPPGLSPPSNAPIATVPSCLPNITAPVATHPSHVIMSDSNEQEAMQDVLEANMPEDSTEVSDIGQLNPNMFMIAHGTMTAEAIKHKLIQRLGNFAVNVNTTRIPSKTDVDYEVNDRDTFEFLGLHASKCNTTDVLRKFRMAARVVHPDKTSHFPSQVSSWANNIMQLLSQAKDEAIWRVERISLTNQVSNVFSMQDY